MEIRVCEGERAAMLTVQGGVRKADSSSFLGNPSAPRQTPRHFRRSTFRPHMTRKLFILAARSLAGLALAGAAGTVSAQVPTSWVAGKHYSAIAPQRTNVAAGKVEVMEVFSYGCPA